MRFEILQSFLQIKKVCIEMHTDWRSYEIYTQGRLLFRNRH